MKSSIGNQEICRSGLGRTALLASLNVQQFAFTALPKTCQGLWGELQRTVFSFSHGCWWKMLRDQLTCQEHRQKQKSQQSYHCILYPLRSYIISTWVNFISYSLVCGIQSIYSSFLDIYSRYENYDYFIICYFIYVEVQ